VHLELRADPEFPFPPGVRVRILGRDDIDLLVEHVMALDAEGRRDRFNGAASAEFVAGYAKKCISPGTLVLAAEHSGKVIGVAELHPSDAMSAELAFSVLDAWRGKGIGAALFAMIAEAAWSRGLSHIEITTHAGNEAMKRLARRFGTELRFEQGETFGRIALDEIHMLDSEGNHQHWTPDPQRRKRGAR
jgi:hypothetical protein